MRLRGNFSAIIRIVNNEVRIAADLDRTFARKKTEKFRCLSARGFNESLQIDPTSLHAMREVKIHAIFQRRNAVGNFRKIIVAHSLLRFEIERGMIGRKRGNRAITQTMPKDCLILLSRSGGDITFFAPSKFGLSASVRSSNKYWISVSTETFTPASRRASLRAKPPRNSCARHKPMRL